MSVTSTYPTLLDEFFSIADNPLMNEPGRTALDVIAELQSAIAAVQASLGVTGALNYMRATGNVAQTVTGLKTFSNGLQTPWITFGSQRNSIGVDLQIPGGGTGNDFSRVDNAIATGAWRYDHTAGDSGGPLTERGVVFHSRRTGGGGETQLFVGEVSGRCFTRARVSGGWTAWREYASLSSANAWEVAQTFNSNIVVNGVIIGSSASGVRVQTNTVDGSDTSEAYLSGGGSAGTARGAYVRAQGNEHPSRPGLLELYGGAVSGGAIVAGSNMGFGGNASPTCALANGAFSQLGATDVPRRSHYITGTTSFTPGTPTNIAHGLDLAKILYYELLIQTGDSAGFTTQHTNNVTHRVDSTNFQITPQASSTAGKAFRCSIWYRD